MKQLKYKNPYYNTYHTEYFAESFRLYLQDNAEFKDFQTYKTIERIIKNEEK